MKIGGKFSKRVENTVGKGEIAGYDKFLLFLLYFQKICTTDTYKQGIVWERIYSLPSNKHLNSSKFKGFKNLEVCGPYYQIHVWQTLRTGFQLFPFNLNPLLKDKILDHNK